MNEQICPNCNEAMTAEVSSYPGAAVMPEKVYWQCWECELAYPAAPTLEASTAAFERLRDPLAGGEWPKCPVCKVNLGVQLMLDGFNAWCDNTSCIRHDEVFSVAPTLPLLLAKLREPPKPKPLPCPEHPLVPPDSYGKRIWCPAQGCNRTAEGGTFTETLAMWNAGMLAAKEKP